MPRTPRKKGTYYDRTSGDRKEYQLEYYEKNKESLRRKRELDKILNPEAYARYLEYQRQYGKTRNRKGTRTKPRNG